MQSSRRVPFAHEAELLQHAGRCHIACIGLSLDAIQVQRAECPPQQDARGLRRVAVSPRCLAVAVAQRCTAVVRIPPVQAAPADERLIGDTIHGQPCPGPLLRHLPASRDETLGARGFAPRRRVPVAQDVGVAVQGEEVVRIRVVEGTQSKANGVQRRSGQRHARHVPLANGWPVNQISDAGHSQPVSRSRRPNAATGPGRSPRPGPPRR